MVLFEVVILEELFCRYGISLFGKMGGDFYFYIGCKGGIIFVIDFYLNENYNVFIEVGGLIVI